MRYFTITLLLVFMFLNFPAFNQISESWVSLYNHEEANTDEPTDMVVDSEGNIYISGWTTTEVHDFITLKYNSFGELLWTQFYDGPMNESDKAEAIAIDNSGNVYVIGSSQTQTWGDIAIIKYSPDGDQLWLQYYDNTSTDGGYDIGIGENGMIYAVGYSNSNMITLQYDPDGELQWASTYEGSDNSLDIGFSLVLDELSNVYITGYSKGTGTSRDITTIKYNAEGVEQWIGIYDGPGHFSDEGYEIALDEMNNVYVLGYSNDEQSNVQYATIKYNSAGIEQWVSRYYNPSTLKGSPTGLAVFDSENIYVCGAAGQGYATVKINSVGDTVWVRKYGLNNDVDQSANDIFTDNSGNIYVTGWTRVIVGNDYRDYGTIKYDPAGNLLWDIRYEGPDGGRDDAIKVAIDNTNHVIVTGVTFESETSYDIGTIRYSQSPVSIGAESSPDEPKFSLYPNPAHNIVELQLASFNRQNGILCVFDSYGILVIEKQIPVGTEYFEVDVSSLQSGVYFCRVNNDKYATTKRFIIQK